MRISLNGYVAADEDLFLYEFFGYPAFSPATVRQALRDTPEGESLILEINSCGGSVFAGAEIYSVLKEAAVSTRAEIQSLSASAASYAMLGADEVWISPVAQVMIHLPSTATEGDRTAHRESIKVLDSIAKSALNAYELKCKGKKTRDELSRMLTATTWMDAQEALDAGLVDGILYQDQDSGIAPGAIVNAVGGGIRAMAGGMAAPTAAELRAAYYKQTGKCEEGEPADWRVNARLEIEKNRFGGNDK